MINKIVLFIDKILAYCNLENPQFFDLLNDQLVLLSEILDKTTSRIVLYEFIEKIMEQMIAIKFLWCQLTQNEIRENVVNKLNYTMGTAGNMTGNGMSHKNSPRFTTNTNT